MKKFIPLFCLVFLVCLSSCSSKKSLPLDRGQEVILTPRISRLIKVYKNEWVPFYQRAHARQKRIAKRPRSIKRWRKLKRIQGRMKYAKLFSNRLKQEIDILMIRQGYTRQTRRNILRQLQLE
ncbi:MAG: hypothetical protein MRY57_00630 [Candidatus Pacebacteria bacterium]|nr:hypothetical protein [Candidatus Paceibacterota bacterium]